MSKSLPAYYHALILYGILKKIKGTKIKGDRYCFNLQISKSAGTGTCFTLNDFLTKHLVLLEKGYTFVLRCVRYCYVYLVAPLEMELKS